MLSICRTRVTKIEYPMCPGINRPGSTPPGTWVLAIPAQSSFTKSQAERFISSTTMKTMARACHIMPLFSRKSRTYTPITLPPMTSILTRLVQAYQPAKSEPISESSSSRCQPLNCALRTVLKLCGVYSRAFGLTQSNASISSSASKTIEKNLIKG